MDENLMRLIDLAHRKQLDPEYQPLPARTPPANVMLGDGIYLTNREKDMIMNAGSDGSGELFSVGDTPQLTL